VATAGTQEKSIGESQPAKLSREGAADCPYVASGPAACHCRNLNSRTAPLIVRYCGGEYRACDLFRAEEAGGKKR